MDKFLKRKLEWTTKTQHHSFQLRAIFHDRQWYIAFNNHQHEVFNESNLNMVAFFW
jgi:hypothetical protein